jgi:hypothetical protein
LQVALIDDMLAENFNKNSKVADQLCQKFEIPLENYPKLIEQRIRNSVRFFVGKFSKKED